MVYTESITEMINGNTQNCIDELQDKKNAMELLLEGAGNIVPEDTPTADNNNEIEEKKEALVEKIEDWDSHDNIYELAQWFNELRELVGDDEIDIPYLSGNCFQMDLYRRIEAIFPLITCGIDSDVLYRNDDGVFVVENINILYKKHLTEADKREVVHILVDRMEDYQLDEVLSHTWL